MKTKKFSNRNGELDFFRFVFCFIIFIFHINIDSNSSTKIFNTGNIGVEFFFILSGLLFANSISKRNEKKPYNPIHYSEKNEFNKKILNENFSYIFKKFKTILPYHIIVFLAGVAFYIKNAKDIKEILHIISASIPQFFFLTMPGLNDFNQIVSVEWYLSAMLFVMFILYPILRKHYYTYAFYIGPIVSLIIVGYFVNVLKTPIYILKWNTFSYMGTLRAFYLMTFGIIACEFGKKLMQITSFCKKMLLTVICIIGYASIILFANAKTDLPDIAKKQDVLPTTIGFTCIILLTLAIAISFSKANLFSRLFNNRISYFLGQISLPFYLMTNITRSITKILKYNEMSYTKYVCISFAINFIISVIIYIFVQLFKKINNNKKAKAQSLKD